MPTVEDDSMIETQQPKLTDNLEEVVQVIEDKKYEETRIPSHRKRWKFIQYLHQICLITPENPQKKVLEKEILRLLQKYPSIWDGNTLMLAIKRNLTGVFYQLIEGFIETTKTTEYSAVIPDKRHLDEAIKQGKVTFTIEILRKNLSLSSFTSKALHTLLINITNIHERHKHTLEQDEFNVLLQLTLTTKQSKPKNLCNLVLLIQLVIDGKVASNTVHITILEQHLENQNNVDAEIGALQIRLKELLQGNFEADENLFLSALFQVNSAFDGGNDNDIDNSSPLPENTWLDRANKILNFIWVQIIWRFRFVFIAGLFVALGFAVFASSISFGLAVKSGFLMAGALGNQPFVFALAALTVTLISHLVMRMLKPSMANTPTSQALLSIQAAQKILNTWKKFADDTPPEIAARLSKALSAHLEKIQEIFEEPWSSTFVINSHLFQANAQRYIDFLEVAEITLTSNHFLSLEQRQQLAAFLSNLSNQTYIDPNYRPEFPGVKIVLWSAIAAAFLMGCTIMFFYIFIAHILPPALGPIKGMVWSLPLAAVLGILSWFSARHVLNHYSGGAYAKLATIFSAGTVIFATLAVFLPTSTVTPIIAAAASSLALVFIISATLAHQNAKLESTERIKRLTSLSQQPIRQKHLIYLGLVLAWATCVVPIFFIISGAFNPWFLILSMPAGFTALVLTDYTLNRFSNSPFATLAAVSLLGLMTVALIWPLSGIGLSLPFIFVCLGLIGSFSVAAFFLAQDKNKVTARAGQEGERLLHISQIALIVGFLFLAFVSIAMALNLGHLGYLSGLLKLGSDLMTVALGYGGLKVGAQWLSVFFISIFSTAGFLAFVSLQQLLQRSAANMMELNQHQPFITAGVMLLKLIFTVGLIALLTAMPAAAFPTTAITTILPVFIIVAAIMPLFSGNARLPYLHALNDFWNNQLLGGLGISPLLDQEGSLRWSRYIMREIFIMAIICSISVGSYFASGTSVISLTVLATSAVTTILVRYTALWQNAQEDMTKNQSDMVNINLDPINLPLTQNNENQRTPSPDDSKQHQGVSFSQLLSIIPPLGSQSSPVSSDDDLEGIGDMEETGEYHDERERTHSFNVPGFSPGELSEIPLNDDLEPECNPNSLESVSLLS